MPNRYARIEPRLRVPAAFPVVWGRAPDPRLVRLARINGLTNFQLGAAYGTGKQVPVPATGATAGIPGTWTPAGAEPPATVAALIAGTPNAVTASPTAAWTTGQFVQTATAGPTGRATWSGTAWVGGVAP